MSAASLLPPVAEVCLPRKKFTRTEVYQMLEAGVLAGARFELIHGDVIDKMGRSARHSFSIRKLASQFGRRFDPDLVQVQSPVEMHRSDSEFSEPEPDIVVLRRDDVAYGKRHPRGDELILVVEVSDTSLRGDLTVKRDLYARAGVPEYWVLDVVNLRMTLHRYPSQGKYAETATLNAGESVPVPTRAGDSIALAGLFLDESA